ncbi:MAG: hypothetical protein WAT19_00805 [Ferruginibacter sp.]
MHTGKIIFPVLVTALFCCANPAGKDRPAYFTGEIEYSYSYESNRLNQDSLSNTRPSRGIFRYDSSDYQSSFIGKKDTFTYYYSGRRNKCLSSLNGSIDSTCEDYSIVTDSIINWKLYPADEKLNGQFCDVLEMQKKNSWVRYYVSRQLKLSPTGYNRHKSYNWDFYGEKTGGGLILKLEHRFANFTMKGEAASITEKGKDYHALTIPGSEFEKFCNK